ncbi:MAG TPA: hypothetical protein VFQ72_02285 [Candidatus Paceibacterota bacterium]|nr:hypothetical protein [Candidatus Paceibacterota bacterium]
MKNLPKVKNNSQTDPLESVELSGKQIKDVIESSGVNLVASFIPGLGKFLECIDYANQKIREEKLNNVLKIFISHFDSLDEALAQIKKLVSNRSGIILFQKIIQIVDNGSSDDEWLNILANILKNIAEEDITKHFDERSYFLAQIDRLTPQALIIISKYDLWMQAHIQDTTTTSGQTASGNWSEQVTGFLKTKIGISDGQTGARINHSFRELESAGMIKLEGHQIRLTPVGNEIRRMMKK